MFMESILWKERNSQLHLHPYKERNDVYSGITGPLFVSCEPTA